MYFGTEQALRDKDQLGGSADPDGDDGDDDDDDDDDASDRDTAGDADVVRTTTPPLAHLRSGSWVRGVRVIILSMEVPLEPKLWGLRFWVLGFGVQEVAEVHKNLQSSGYRCHDRFDDDDTSHRHGGIQMDR